MSSLAVRYRPKTFEEVCGQSTIIKILQKQIESDTFKHVYLFCGPTGCGKTTLARIFANEINRGVGEPIEIDGASNYQKFANITLPMVTKLSIPLVISSFAANFNNFGNIYMITQGGPARLDNQFAGYTDILASTTYKMTTWSNRYELSATFSVLIFIIVGTITLISMHASGSFKEVN